MKTLARHPFIIVLWTSTLLSLSSFQSTYHFHYYGWTCTTDNYYHIRLNKHLYRYHYLYHYHYFHQQQQCPSYEIKKHQHTRLDGREWGPFGAARSLLQQHCTESDRVRAGVTRRGRVPGDGPESHGHLSIRTHSILTLTLTHSFSLCLCFLFYSTWG